MAEKLRLTVACGDHEIVRALKEGAGNADGLEVLMVNGMKVGGTNFQPASNIWMRGILEEKYGLRHGQVTWVVERSEDVEFTPPKDLRIEMIAPGKKLDEMLAEGEISAMLSPDLPKLFLKGDKRIVRMFPSYKEIELAYFRNTGIFPIMHVNTIKQE